jgi:hypothetical protein
MNAQEKHFRMLDAMEAEHKEMERLVKATKRKSKLKLRNGKKNKG